MTRTKKTVRVFDTDKRIRLGIWGLGRGMSFFNTCKFLNIDVVAGCDFNDHMRKNFLEQCPGALVTDDADEFLNQDFDAVLLATFCPAHADDAIRCLNAGKHVLSEVTAFHTMDEGVRLVEAVERTGKVYNLAENYPFSPANMYLARKWKEGLFGELMYAEYEYVHVIRYLSYTYIDGQPVQPGWSVHNWRSWQSNHYYCTHSLGPVMVITGERPVRIQSLPGSQRLAGYITGRGDVGFATPSLIRMSNGGLVRNLMGATTNDSHVQRLWGTLGAAEQGCAGGGLQLRLGGDGGSPKFEVTPTLDPLSKLAATTGHGGGDFWVLYYFARQILTGEPAPFDIYGAADVTIPGILAIRSACENGKPYDVPDFRKKCERDDWRGDTWDQKRYDVKHGAFPADADPALTGRFTTIMKSLILCALGYRAYTDWKKVHADMINPGELARLADKVLQQIQTTRETYVEARALADAYPGSDAARVLNEMLEVGGEKEVLAPGFLPALKKEAAALRRRFTGRPEPGLQNLARSALLADKTRIASVAYPARTVKFASARHDAKLGFEDIRPAYDGTPKDGLVYCRGFFTAKKAGAAILRIGADGPFKVFVNRTEVLCNPRATNPITSHIQEIPVACRKGGNEVVIALRTNSGKAWGFIASTSKKAT